MFSPKLLTYLSLWLAGILTVMTIILLTFPEFFAKRDQNHQLKKKRTPFLEKVALVISHAIVMETIGISYSLLTFVLVYYGQWKLLGIALSSIVVSSLIFWGLKRITQRMRPSDALLQLSDYSFPSGHTTAWFVICLTLAAILSIFLPVFLKPMLYTCALGVGAIVGRSRRYLKVHRISDIIAGAVLGIGSFIAACLFFLYFGDALITAVEIVFNSFS